MSTAAWGGLGPAESRQQEPLSPLAESLVSVLLDRIESDAGDVSRELWLFELLLEADREAVATSVLEADGLVTLERALTASDPSSSMLQSLRQHVLSVLDLDDPAGDTAIEVEPAESEAARAEVTATEGRRYHWVRLAVAPGQEYEVRGIDCAASALLVWADTLGFVARGALGELDPWRIAEPERAGTWLLRLEPSPPCDEEAARVAVVRRLPALPLPASPSRDEAAELEIGRSYRVDLTSEGGQWGHFQCDPEHGFEISTSRLQGADTVLEVFRGEAQVRRDDDGGEGLGSRIRLLCWDSARYWVNVRDLGGGGACDLTVLDLGDADRRAAQGIELPIPRELAARAANSLPVDRLVEGSVEESSWWGRLSVDEPGLYLIETQNLQAGLDSIIELFTMDSAQVLMGIDRDDDGGEGSASSLLSELDPGRDYFLEVTAYSGTTGRFELRVQALSPEEAIDRGLALPPKRLLGSAGRDEAPRVDLDTAYELLLTRTAWARVACPADGLGVMYRLEASSESFDEIRVSAMRGDEAYREGTTLFDDLRFGWFCPAAGEFDLRFEVLDAPSGQVRFAVRPSDPVELIELSLSEERPASLGGSGSSAYLLRGVLGGRSFGSLAAHERDLFELRLEVVDGSSEVQARIHSPAKELVREVGPASDLESSWTAEEEGDYLVELVGLTESTALLEISRSRPHDGYRVGDRVILGRHEVVDGSENWAAAMADYVGRVATITELTGPEVDTGLYLVRVDIDDGEWVWRTRNLQRASEQGTASPEPGPGRTVKAVPAKRPGG